MSVYEIGYTYENKNCFILNFEVRQWERVVWFIKVHMLLQQKLDRKSLKIPKGWSEVVKCRETDNKYNGKQTKIMVHKIHHETGATDGATWTSDTQTWKCLKVTFNINSLSSIYIETSS